MKRLTIRLSGTLAAIAGLAVVAPLAGASADPIVYYNPPKMVKRGTNSSAVAGAGKVVIKVLVDTDGTYKSGTVIVSTNHGDDAAAMEIAKSSTYAPATRGKKKEVAYYDFTLRFTGGGAAVDDTSGPAKYEAMLRSGNYSAAQTGLKTYVSENPSDSRGQLDLGIADTYLSDYTSATAAFDKAGAIPAADQAVAGKAYVDYAVGLLNAKDYANGLTAAKHAAQVTPGFAAQDTLGVAEMQSGDAQSAVADLEKAHDLAKSATGVSTAGKVADDEHLVQAYLAAGSMDKAHAIASEATTLDAASSTVIASEFAQSYAAQAADAAKAGKNDAAGALYEQGAQADPSQATLLYTSAAIAYLKVTPSPENDKAKAAADKALAANPKDAAANYAEGVALANQGKSNDAKTYLTQADALAKVAGNTALAQAVEKALDQLTGARMTNEVSKPS